MVGLRFGVELYRQGNVVSERFSGHVDFDGIAFSRNDKGIFAVDIPMPVIPDGDHAAVFAVFAILAVLSVGAVLAVLAVYAVFTVQPVLSVLAVQTIPAVLTVFSVPAPDFAQILSGTVREGTNQFSRFVDKKRRAFSVPRIPQPKERS